MSDEEYTPTTADVRARYDAMSIGPDPYAHGPEFDRWLAGVIAQAKADALEEFAHKLSGHYTLNFQSGDTMYEQIVRLLKRDAGIIREAVQS